MNRKNLLNVLVIMVVTCAWTDALAYIGPGIGIGVIGTVLAFIGAVLLALVGFIWYPIKRLRARIRKKRSRPTEAPKE